MLFDDMDFESKKNQLINMIESIEQKQSYMIENNIRNPVLWKDFEDRKVLLKINFMKIREEYLHFEKKLCEFRDQGRLCSIIEEDIILCDDK